MKKINKRIIFQICFFITLCLIGLICNHYSGGETVAYRWHAFYLNVLRIFNLTL